MDTITGRMRAAYSVVRRIFKVRILPLFAAWMWVNIRLVVAVGMALDPLFFPKLRRTEVKKPIVLVGNPRTGTTFLQRFLCDEGYGAGLEVYRMLYPSLLIQTVLRPFLPILEVIAPTRYHRTKAHDTSLQSVETDDVGVLFRHFDGFFLYGFFLAFDEVDHEKQFAPEVRDTSERDFDWLETMWKRSLVAHGHDVAIAKLFSLGTRLPQFLARFPDARILYMARDPLATIPSGMSLVTGVLDNAFGFWKLPDDIKQRWFDRLYNGLVELQRRFLDDYVSGKIKRDQVFIVRYDRMMVDFDGLMDDMHTFLGHPPTDAQKAAILQQAEIQRSYKSEHTYNLAKFGLDEAKIRKDCASFYETFLPPLEKSSASAPVAPEPRVPAVSDLEQNIPSSGDPATEIAEESVPAAKPAASAAKTAPAAEEPVAAEPAVEPNTPAAAEPAATAAAEPAAAEPAEASAPAEEPTEKSA